MSTVAPVAASSGAALPASSHPLLRDAIFPTLLRLSVPNMVAMGMAVLVAVAETYYVGRLGTTALAAMALVFPLAMLTQMMSNGAMGSGVSSAISRALGGGDKDKASALAVHAIVIGGVVGVLYSLLFVLCGAVFYRWLGGQGQVLQAATDFGSVLFSGAVLVWLCNTLASVVRGTGNMKLPSAILFGVSMLQIAIGGGLGLGLGPFPHWGMTGVAVGNIVAMALAVVLLLWYLLRGQDKLQLRGHGAALSWPMFKDILRVGAFACISPVQTSLAALIFTGMVARLGPQALAGYGIGQRLEFLLIPIAFGVGVAAVPMVGMAMGAGQVQRGVDGGLAGRCHFGGAGLAGADLAQRMVRHLYARRSGACLCQPVSAHRRPGVWVVWHGAGVVLCFAGGGLCAWARTGGHRAPGGGHGRWRLVDAGWRSQCACAVHLGGGSHGAVRCVHSVGGLAHTLAAQLSNKNKR